jgi:PKD domain
MAKLCRRTIIRATAITAAALLAGSGLIMVRTGTAAAASAPAAPFNQCPAIGASPGCQILLVVNPDNTVSVYGDSSVGPYDGSDDTLVGIVNDSTSGVKAVTVSGPGSGLSLFDDDGICSGAYGTWNGSSGCPYGPTGYEGPGTSFVTSASLPDSAEVDFTGGLAPGKSAYFSLEGVLTSAELTAREGTLQQFDCPGAGQSVPVTLPAVHAPVIDPDKHFSVSYGSLPLTFTSAQPDPGALCTVVSNRGALPVYIDVLGQSLQVAASVTTATVDFYPADSSLTDVPECDFSLLDNLLSVGQVPLLDDFASTNNCLLTASDHAKGGVIAEWSIPGFAEYVRDQNGKRIYTTPPLTYYVDLSALPYGPASFQETLQALETYIHTTLIQNLPMVSTIGVFQDPPANLLVTDPQGRTVGVSRFGRTASFPGSGYAVVGDRSIAWILEPIPGTYHVTASGQPQSAFHTDLTVLQLLGHGTDPLTQNTVWDGTLGFTGTASTTFSVPGASLVPVLTPHEDYIPWLPLLTVRFSLAGSTIPFGSASVTWDFGDGTHATGMTVTHRYAAVGKYTPEVTVTTALGTTVTSTLQPVVVP